MWKECAFRKCCGWLYSNQCSKRLVSDLYIHIYLQVACNIKTIKVYRTTNFLFLHEKMWVKIGVSLQEKSGRDTPVGIAARHRMDGPGVESRWGGETFRVLPYRPWSLPSLVYNGYRVFPRGKSAEAWRWPPTPSSAEVKEKVELYIYSPYGPSWPVLGRNLPLNCKGET